MPRVPFSQKRALEILGVTPEASREERSRMFHEKRELLERELNAAMTPGLKGRYQDALNDLTQAFEALELDATEWNLESLEGTPRDPSGPESAAEPAKSVPGLSGLSPWAAQEEQGPKRFIRPIVAALILIVVVAFGWTWKKRADAERIAEDAVARVEREKAEERARLERVQQAVAVREAELKVADERRAAERRSELEKQVRTQMAEQQARLRQVQPYLDHVEEAVRKQRDAARSLGEDAGWQQEWTRRRLSLLEAYEASLKSFTQQHPARVHLQSAERLFQAGDPDAALAEIQLAASFAEHLKNEPEERRYAMVGKPLIDWLTKGDVEWPESALATLRSEESSAVARAVAALRENLSYLDRPGTKAVNADWRDKMLPLRALAGAGDAGFLRWQRRFMGSVRVETTPSGATLVDEKGIAMGVTPVKFELMRGDSLNLTASLKGHISTSLVAAVGLGDEQVVTVTLPEIPVPRPGHSYTISGLGLGLIWIPSGTFTMGSPASEPSRAADEGPQIKVRIAEGYWMGRYEVTQGEWVALMTSNPSQFKAVGPEGPVESVSWRETMEFCRRLTEREKAAERLPAGFVYTLPTEAQWEYACRAGTSGAYAGDLDAMGWYIKDDAGMSHAVGKKVPNEWGLYDMHGNVWEWCLDWYSDSLQVDAHGMQVSPQTGTYRVSRGGSWNCPAGNCRSALRRWLSPTDRGNRLGFRVVLTHAKP